MAVHLRPHHLLCLLTYIGKGYTPAFVDNYNRIAGRLSAGETVTILDGPDDVCAPIADDPGSHCRRSSVMERDRRAAEAVTSLLGMPIAAGTTLTLDRAVLGTLRSAFAAGQIRDACTDCEWSGLCTAVAASDYTGARVQRA